MSIPVKFLDGRYFPTKTAAAAAIGISVPALEKRLDSWQYPFSSEKPDRGLKNSKACYFRGKVYRSRTAAAKANKISISSVIYAIKKQK